MFKLLSSSIVLAAAIVASSAQAADVASCTAKAQQICGTSDLFESILTANADECKNLKSASGNTRYQIYRINGHILSVALDGPGACQFQFASMSDDHAKEVKVFGNKATILGTDGGAYVLRYEGEDAKFYRFYTGGGNPYGTTVKVTDIVGDESTVDQDDFVIKLSDGNSRKIDADEIQKQVERRRLRLYPTDQFDVHSSWGLILAIQSPPPSEEGDEDEPLAPPPPGGYDYEVRDVFASYGWGTEESLGKCKGYIRATKVNSYRAKVEFSVGKCSNLTFAERGFIEDDGKLDTSDKPYTGKWILRGNPDSTNGNRVKVTLNSNSGNTGVVVWVHF